MNTYGTGRQGSFEKAMALMQANTFDATKVGGSGAENRLAALEKANAWTNQGLSALGAAASNSTAMAGQAAAQGLQMIGQDAAQRAEMAAAKTQAREQNKQNWLGTIGTVVGIGASLLCERRLKSDIQALDAERAWRAVRDVPYYQFRYRSNPGSVAYGPIVDEVELVDDTLVRPSMLPDDEKGPIRGFDIMRWQAYESVALAAALNRIEELEAQIAQLGDAVQRLQLDHTLRAA